MANRISIFCNEHKIYFNQLAYAHVSLRQGCPECGRERMSLPIDVFIKRAIAVHGNKYDYTKTRIRNTSTKVNIICKVHGEFYQLPSSHIASIGCPKCAGNHNYTTEEFIARSKEVHGDEYTYVDTVYKRIKDNVIITCRKHGNFTVLPRVHLGGSKCRKCSGKEPVTTAIFIQHAKEIHGDLYSYTNVNYVDSYTKVSITCNKHKKDFMMRPNSHIGSRQGCPSCGGKDKITTDIFIKRAIKIHGNKYLYDEVKYVTNTNKVKIFCKKHKEYFMQSPVAHIDSAAGCQKCAMDLRKKAMSSNLDKFIIDAKEVHGDRYDYSKVEYKNNKTKIIVICKEHGPFKIKPNSHLSSNSGCPICSSSKGEIKIYDYLKKHKINFISEYIIPHTDRQFRYDFYLPDLNILIEYDGIQHFIPIDFFGGKIGLEKRISSDKDKTILAKKEGFKLIRIKYTKFKILTQYLTLRISNFFKYKNNDLYIKNIVMLCEVLKLPKTTEPKDVSHLLTYNKDVMS